MTTELGRQPWLVYGLQRTIHGTSPLVSAGNVVFSILGFMGLYLVMGVLFLYLVFREIDHGPVPREAVPADSPDGSASIPAPSLDGPSSIQPIGDQRRSEAGKV